MAFWKGKTDELAQDEVPVDAAVEADVETALAEAALGNGRQPQPEPVLDDSTRKQNEFFQRIKSEIHRQVIAKLDLSTLGTMREEELRVTVRRGAEQ